MRCFSVVLHNTKILNLSLRLKARDFPPDGDINNSKVYYRAGNRHCFQQYCEKSKNCIFVKGFS
jgi:hypothetical protein